MTSNRTCVLEYSCNKYSNLIGQLEVHYIILLMDLPRGLISRSNAVQPRVEKDAQCNSISTSPGQMSWLL